MYTKVKIRNIMCLHMMFNLLHHTVFVCAEAAAV